MKKIRRYTNRVEAFLQSDAGQRFFNVAYSVGAAIVLWGALFQILHIRGGATLLCVGMGTEIFMFILTAFDRPPKDPDWDEIIPHLKGGSKSFETQPLTIIDDTDQCSALPDSTAKFGEAIEKITSQMKELQELMKSGNEGYARQIVELNKNLAGLNSIYELQLKNISGQLATMENLNHGLKDISDTYDKSVSNSEKYFEETEKMTNYLRQINEVYAGMISAMKIKA